MVRISTLFLAVSAIGSLFVSALDVPASAIEARDSDLSISFIKHINIYYTLPGLAKGVVSADADINLGLLIPFEATLDGFNVNVTSSGVFELSIDYNFPTPGMVLPAWTTRNTGRIDNVKANPQLWSIFNVVLIDVNANIRARAPTIAGAAGFPLRFDGTQSSVPITFHYELS